MQCSGSWHGNDEGRGWEMCWDFDASLRGLSSPVPHMLPAGGTNEEKQGGWWHAGMLTPLSLCPHLSLFMDSQLRCWWILGCTPAEPHVARKGNSPPLQKSPSWWDRLKWHFPFSLMIPWAPLASAGPSNSIPDASISQPSLWLLQLSDQCSSCPAPHAPFARRFADLSVLTMTAPDMPVPACLSAGPLSWRNQNTNAYFQNVGSCWKSRWGEQQHPGREHWGAERGEGWECSWKVWDNLNSLQISYGFPAPCKKTVFTWISHSCILSSLLSIVQEVEQMDPKESMCLEGEVQHIKLEDTADHYCDSEIKNQNPKCCNLGCHTFFPNLL